MKKSKLTFEDFTKNQVEVLTGTSVHSVKGGKSDQGSKSKIDPD